MLTERLHALNPLRQGNARHGLPDEAVQEAIGRLRRAVADWSKGLLGGNAAVTDLLRLGTSVDVTLANERGEARAQGRQLRFVDWDVPEKNVFHMTAEFAVQRECAADTRRPDIVLFVNGVPLVVIEVKASSIAADQGISQQLRNQNVDEIPRLPSSACTSVPCPTGRAHAISAETSHRLRATSRELTCFGTAFTSCLTKHGRAVAQSG